MSIRLNLSPERKVVEEPKLDGKTQLCPQCGTSKEVMKPVSFCKGCGSRVAWTGPLWGSK